MRQQDVTEWGGINITYFNAESTNASMMRFDLNETIALERAFVTGEELAKRYAHTHTHTHTYNTPTHKRTHKHTHTHIHTHTHTRTRTHAHTHTHAHAHTHTQA
jgi:hypothetical protein